MCSAFEDPHAKDHTCDEFDYMIEDDEDEDDEDDEDEEDEDDEDDEDDDEEFTHTHTQKNNKHIVFFCMDCVCVWLEE